MINAPGTEGCGRMSREASCSRSSSLRKGTWQPIFAHVSTIHGRRLESLMHKLRSAQAISAPSSISRTKLPKTQMPLLRVSEGRVERVNCGGPLARSCARGRSSGSRNNAPCAPRCGRNTGSPSCGGDACSGHRSSLPIGSAGNCSLRLGRALNRALQCEQRTEPCAAASSAAPILKMVRHSGHWVYMPAILSCRRDQRRRPSMRTQSSQTVADSSSNHSE